MAEKKIKSDKPKIQIQTRKPEKRGIFANLGVDRDKNEHPLREILNFPDPKSLDIQNNFEEKSDDESLGYPTISGLDIQTNETEYPNNKELDIQNNLTGHPNNQNTDIQTKNIGNPPLPQTDILISKTSKRISKKNEDLDSKISEDQNLDSQNDKEKSEWRKYEQKRKSKGVFLRTNDEITKKFKQFCIGQDWEFSEGTEIAWNRLMNDPDIQSSSGLDSLIAHDDRRLKMLYKTKPFIINLYLQYNSVFNEISTGGKKWTAKWSPRDDESGVRYNDILPEIVELGILQTQIQKGIGTGRIQTFKYYLDEIENVLSSGASDEMLKTILQYHRQIWEKQTRREVDLSFLQNS